MDTKPKIKQVDLRRRLIWSRLKSSKCYSAQSRNALRGSVYRHLRSVGTKNFRKLTKGLENGKQDLRRKQWRLADRNAAMAIWLGSNILVRKISPMVNLILQ